MERGERTDKSAEGSSGIESTESFAAASPSPDDGSSHIMTADRLLRLAVIENVLCLTAERGLRV
eukprot:3576721-Rhodomonas_salina.1